MDRQEKIKLLTRAAQYDLCAPTGRAGGNRGSHGQTPNPQARDDLSHWLFPAALPNGRHVALLKVLQSNMCENNCLYCGMRRARNVERCQFGPDELAAAFDQLVRRRLAEGLFLSSAVCGSAAHTQERMIATVELVRLKYDFSGYVHLKLLPGCEPAAIERAVQLADRVSVNLEAPSVERLRKLSGDKQFDHELVQPMRDYRDVRAQNPDAKADLTTQFVVGPAGESDHEILATAERLRSDFGLTRTYFSAFNPVQGTPLENHPPTPLQRQNRLYQSDYLLRFYGFTVQDLTFDDMGNLSTDADPKMAWAQRHPEFFPVEVNRASREQLLRVPGIGPRSAARIVRLRREATFRYLEDLRAIGAVASRAAPFVLLNGRSAPRQLALC